MGPGIVDIRIRVYGRIGVRDGGRGHVGMWI